MFANHANRRNRAVASFPHPRIATPGANLPARLQNTPFSIWVVDPVRQSFCFWLGTHESHRAFQDGAGVKTGKELSKIVVPAVFPDNELVRSDIADYLVEVEHFDSMVERAIATLEKRGLLDNTIVVVTSDHGMPFPRAKASLYDLGSRVPLAIRWPEGIEKAGRVVDSFVNLSDLAPTFLEASGLKPPSMMSARGMLDVFANGETKTRDAAYIAMERHDGCRAGGKGYPCRAIRTADFMYIHNFEPSRWPSGSPDASVCARAIPYGTTFRSTSAQASLRCCWAPTEPAKPRCSP